MRAWKTAGLAGGGVVLAAFIFNLTAPGARDPSSPMPSIEELKQQQLTLNEQCRGGAGGAPETDFACNRRDQVTAKLEAADVCWGNNGEPPERRGWRSCKELANDEVAKPLNPRGASVLYKLAHPEEGVRYAEAERARILSDRGDVQPSTEIQYDPDSAQKTARTDAAMRATRGCLRGQAGATIRLGLRNRDEVAERIAAACRHPLTFIGLFSIDEITTFTKTMAYDAISDFEEENR